MPENNTYQEKNKMPLAGTTLLEWNIKETKSINQSWKIGIMIFLILSFAFFLWQKNYFGAMLIFLIAYLIFYLPRKKEKNYFAITDKGALIEKEIFPWGNLESFWVFAEPAEIYFKSKKSYLSYIIFPLPKEHLNNAREILLSFLPEKEAERNFFDVMSKKIGF